MRKLFTKYGINIDEGAAEKLTVYRDLLLKYNEVMNLTAITDISEINVKHFLDSLAGAKYLSGKVNIADIGSGAGFPAVPLAIFMPDSHFTMLDSVNKKIGFLNTVIETLPLKNACARHTRIEDEGKSKTRETFDAVIARAVSGLPTLTEYALPLLKTGGLFLAYKGEKGLEELAESKKAIEVLGGKVVFSETVNLENNTRVFIGIEKIKSTPPIFPRGGNKPRLNPII